MDGRYWVIDEVSLSILGTFNTRGEAVDSVAALVAVNDDDFLDELTISNDAGPLLYGDTLRNALRNREAARKRIASSARGNGSKHSPAAAMAAKTYRS
jgi:hypothetical protein